MPISASIEKFPDLRGAGDLVNHFRLTVVQAARTRKASVTKLKALCRARGVKRWPWSALQKGKPKCHTSGESVPVVESVYECECECECPSCAVDECPSCAVVPETQTINWRVDRWIVNMFAHLPPRNTEDQPPPSPPDRPTLPAAQICPFFRRPIRRPPPRANLTRHQPAHPNPTSSAGSLCLHHAMAGQKVWHDGVIL